jgi:hypothetical protein
MEQSKLPARRRSSEVFMVALALLILGLAFLAAPQTSSAQDAPDAGTVPPLPALRPSITFVHAAAFDADVALTAVDVCTEEGEVVPGLANITYGEGRTLSFDPGSFDWTIAAVGSDCLTELLDLEPFGLGYGTIRILVLAGDNVNQPLEVLDVLAQEGGGAVFMPIVFRPADPT